MDSDTTGTTRPARAVDLVALSHACLVYDFDVTRFETVVRAGEVLHRV